MKKLLIGSLLTLAMAWGISLGDTALEKSQVISYNDQEVQVASDLPFEH
ncbi:quorum-sensing peptide PapR [Bacillus mycoides]|uniref:Cell-cell signaling protein PapR n=1 Tax=Bacillus cereus TaxID=1396 RepID=A0A1S9TRS0_BACCE|nr:quorum-sensing peptide PapR [Bacillus cereus]KZD32685.1 PlcR activating protein PapR quorum-sensing effector [Bacillus cereus]OOR12746.1 cell-cell signaling protein PapR [Bacillus cereus]